MAKQPMIEIEIGNEEEELKGMDEKYKSEIEMGKEEEDAGFMSLLQGVTLSPKPLTGLVNALNKVLPLFGAPTISGKELSVDVVRGLAMVAQAVSDAAETEEIPMELSFSLEDLQGGDTAAQMVAGKLDRLSKTGSFRKFLKAKPTETSTPSNQEPMGDPMAMAKTEEQSPNIEALFASRM